MYFIFYRSLGIFHEHLVNKILDDIVKACGPRWAKVEVVMNPRGGISTTVTAEYKTSLKGAIPASSVKDLPRKAGSKPEQGIKDRR